MKELTIKNLDGIHVIDSRDVAEMVDKRHDNLVRDILGYCKILENSKMSSQDFFIASTYKTEKNTKIYPCYLLTRKGCDMVANKMTGEKGVLFTATYVTKFEEMEKQTNQFELSKELKAIFTLDTRTVEQDKRITKLENTMTIDYGQQQELRTIANKVVVKALGGKTAPAYKRLSNKAFSEIWNVYKREMNVNSYRNTPTKDFELGKGKIENWKPSEDLELMIKGANV